MKYRFYTRTVPRVRYTDDGDYVQPDFWIDSNYVKDTYFYADTVRDALIQYRDYCRHSYYVNISTSAFKHPNKMYVDNISTNTTDCIGYVYLASTDIDFGGKFVKRYVELWVQIEEVRVPEL